MSRLTSQTRWDMTNKLYANNGIYVKSYEKINEQYFIAKTGGW